MDVATLTSQLVLKASVLIVTAAMFVFWSQKWPYLNERVQSYLQ